MTKKEILSLIEALLSIFSLWMTVLLGKSEWWGLTFISFIVLLLASTGIFKGIGKKANRVEAIMRWVAFSGAVLITIYGLYRESIRDHENRWFILFYLVGLLAVFIHLLFSYFSPKGWFHRRLQWMEGKALLIQKSGNVLYAMSASHTTVYFYPLSEQLVGIGRKMFTNPLRHEKECEERRYQIRTRLKQAKLPVDVEEITDVSLFYFETIVRIRKEDATKVILRRIIDILSEMSDDDCHVYFSYRIDEELWYIHSFRFEVVQSNVYIMSSDGTYHDNQEKENHAKHQPEELLYKVMNVKASVDSVLSLDELEGFSIITSEEFEQAVRDNSTNLQ